MSLAYRFAQKLRTLGFLKRFMRLVRWRLHVWTDAWGALVWTRARQTQTPLGFTLVAGLHPAYEQMRRGTFEVGETALIRRLLDDCDRFIDIGANLGYYSCIALQAKRPVIAFEPQPRNLGCLYRNLTINRWDVRYEVFPMALSSEPGILDLYGASGPSASLLKDWAGYSSSFKQQVAVSTLDIVLGERFREERLLIKIDVEGAEHAVLQGAVGTLARAKRPVWLLEICLDEFHPSGMNPDFLAIFRLFWNLGYQAYTAEEFPRPLGKSEVESWWANRQRNPAGFNYLFADPEAPLLAIGPAGRHGDAAGSASSATSGTP